MHDYNTILGVIELRPVKSVMTLCTKNVTGSDGAGLHWDHEPLRGFRLIIG